MANFRRSSLRGSEELFRPTHPDTGNLPEQRDPESAEMAGIAGPALGATQSAPPEPPQVRASGGSLLRLSDEELELLVEAVQRLKFPGQSKSHVRPSMDDFERLEDLRQKLLAARR